MNMLDCEFVQSQAESVMLICEVNNFKKLINEHVSLVAESSLSSFVSGVVEFMKKIFAYIVATIKRLASFFTGGKSKGGGGGGGAAAVARKVYMNGRFLIPDNILKITDRVVGDIDCLQEIQRNVDTYVSNVIINDIDPRGLSSVVRSEIHSILDSRNYDSTLADVVKSASFGDTNSGVLMNKSLIERLNLFYDGFRTSDVYTKSKIIYVNEIKDSLKDIHFALIKNGTDADYNRFKNLYKDEIIKDISIACVGMGSLIDAVLDHDDEALMTRGAELKSKVSSQFDDKMKEFSDIPTVDSVVSDDIYRASINKFRCLFDIEFVPALSLMRDENTIAFKSEKIMDQILTVSPIVYVDEHYIPNDADDIYRTTVQEILASRSMDGGIVDVVEDMCEKVVDVTNKIASLKNMSEYNDDDNNLKRFMTNMSNTLVPMLNMLKHMENMICNIGPITATRVAVINLSDSIIDSNIKFIAIRSVVIMLMNDINKEIGK
ncbi:MAG: hypothetical protein ACRCZ9_12035 [Fusobacteriaceae bacterium]